MPTPIRTSPGNTTVAAICRRPRHGKIIAAGRNPEMLPGHRLAILPEHATDRAPAMAVAPRHARLASGPIAPRHARLASGATLAGEITEAAEADIVAVVVAVAEAGADVEAVEADVAKL